MKKVRLLLVALLAATIVMTVEAQEQILPVLSGQIAYIGADYNVYHLHGGNGTRTMLTDDAGTRDGRTTYYEWPTWSSGGQLAYFRTAFARSGLLNMNVFVSADGGTPGELVYEGENEVFQYAFWSPQTCGEDCRNLAVLLSAADGLLVEMIRSQPVPESTLIGRGAPFYFSWSPDGRRMVWQRNGQQIDVYDVEQDDLIDTLPQRAGQFAAPAWSPVDDRLLVGVLADDETTSLIIRPAAQDAEATTLVEGLTGPVSFAWSPDGNYVAYTDQRGPLLVVDAISGAQVAQSAVSGVLSFFWSPNSQHIAYITLATPPGSFNANAEQGGKLAAQVQETTGLAWSVVDIADGATRRYGSFSPTREMLYLLTYFDQFAQSHRLWSPDSRHLIYGEVSQDNRAVLSLLDATENIAVPLFIAEGVIGIWSFE